MLADCLGKLIQAQNQLSPNPRIDVATKADVEHAISALNYELREMTRWRTLRAIELEACIHSK